MLGQLLKQLAPRPSPNTPPPPDTRISRAPGRAGAHPARVLLQVDGTPGVGAGQGGLGVVIRDLQGRVLCWRCGTAPAQTNNEAEYQALLLGLRVVAERYPGVAVRCLTDSRLVVDQLNGRSTPRAASIGQLYGMAVALLAKMGPVEVVHVPRAVNRLADALAWEALVGTGELLRWAAIQDGGGA